MSIRAGPENIAVDNVQELEGDGLPHRFTRAQFMYPAEASANFEACAQRSRKKRNTFVDPLKARQGCSWGHRSRHKEMK